MLPSISAAEKQSLGEGRGCYLCAPVREWCSVLMAVGAQPGAQSTLSPRQLRAVWEAGLGLPMDVWSTKSKSRVIMWERRIPAAHEGINPSPFRCQSLSSLSHALCPQPAGEVAGLPSCSILAWAASSSRGQPSRGGQVTSSSGLSPGEAEQAGVPQPVPLRSLLRLCEAEGAGVPQHRVDRRVHRPAAQDQDRQLHSHLLTPPCSCPTLPPLEPRGTPVYLLHAP